MSELLTWHPIMLSSLHNSREHQAHDMYMGFDLQTGCRDSTEWYGTRIVVPVMVTGVACPITATCSGGPMVYYDEMASAMELFIIL